MIQQSQPQPESDVHDPAAAAPINTSIGSGTYSRRLFPGNRFIDSLLDKLFSIEFVSKTIAPRLTDPLLASVAGALTISLIGLLLMIFPLFFFIPAIAVPMAVLAALYFSDKFAHVQEYRPIMIGSMIGVLPLMIANILALSQTLQRDQFNTTSLIGVILGVAVVVSVYVVVSSHFLTRFALAGNWKSFAILGSVIVLLVLGAVSAIVVIPFLMLAAGLYFVFLYMRFALRGNRPTTMTNDEIREAMRRSGRR